MYFLKSEKGQQMIDLALKKSESVKKTFVDNSKEIINSSQNAINKVLENSKSRERVGADTSKRSAVSFLEVPVK